MRDWTKYIGKYQAVGSRVTCDPPPTDTDEDFLCFIPANDRDHVDAALAKLGFTTDGRPEFYTGNDNGGFRSWRRGDENLITTSDAAFYDRFVTATHLSKRFNLLEKSDRVALFQAVLYGVDWFSLEGRK